MKAPSKEKIVRALQLTAVVPGEIISVKATCCVNGRRTVELIVANTGDRPFRSARIVIFEAQSCVRLSGEGPMGFGCKFGWNRGAVRAGEDKRVTLFR